jgi:GNAT superfamily N-acetyltransferase
VLSVSRCDDEADEQAALDVHNTVWPRDAITMDEVASFKESVRDYVDYLARADGAVAGEAVGAIVPQRADRVFTIISVLPRYRGHGAGSALYQAISAWAAERGLTQLEVVVGDDDLASLGFARRRGFAEQRRELGVVLHLAEIAPPQIELPAGIQIVTWAERPELARGMYEVVLEAEPDIPGSEDDEIEPYGDWLTHHMRGSGDRPEATFIAVAGDEVVGYAKFWLTAAQPTIARHDLTAVKRAWRGRGVARALKSAQINWALANGYTELHTRNEERNEPIRRLNARFGYRPEAGRIYLLGPLAPS